MPSLADAPSSAESAVAQALPDGVRLAELTEALPLGKTSMFELVKALGIVTTKGPGPGGKGRVAWLTGADAMRLKKAAMDVAAGRLRIADVGALPQAPRTPATLRTLLMQPPAESADAGDPAVLLQRMEAAQRAIRAQFPLTTAEVALIIGVRPGGPVVTRGGILARRLARNLWRLEVAPSADSAIPAPSPPPQRPQRSQTPRTVPKRANRTG